MSVEQKQKFLDRILPEQDNIYLDYLEFHVKKNMDTQALKRKWMQWLKQNKKLQFYLHIPFCSRICTYCMYNTLETHNQKEIDEYIDALIEYLWEFKSVFQEISFYGIYIWGGTPSILSPEQMERLFEYIFENFNFHEEYYKTIEMNPSSTTFEKLDIIRQAGFTRVSFGVQSFNKETLEIENRTYVSPKRIKEIVVYAKNLWFQDINCDLILWLNKEWEKDILFSLREMKWIHPYSITVYTILKDMERSVIYQSDEKTFYEEVKKIYTHILRDSHIEEEYINPAWSNVLGFKLVSKKHPWPLKDYEAHSKEKMSLFAVWHKAFWKIWWEWSYENSHFSLSLISHSFQKLSSELEVYMYILKEFQFQISRQDFLEKFGCKIEEKFWEELKYLEQKGIISIDNEYIKYIWEDRKIGYYGLLFLDRNALIRFVKYRYYEKR